VVASGVVVNGIGMVLVQMCSVLVWIDIHVEKYFTDHDVCIDCTYKTFVRHYTCSITSAVLYTQRPLQ